MTVKTQDTWYVTFQLKQRSARRPTRLRLAETFRTEREAKKFAKAKLINTLNVSAGTLDQHLPKRTIASMQILEWLEEPDEMAKVKDISRPG